MGEKNGGKGTFGFLSRVPPPPFFDIYLGAADASRHTTMTREWRERGEGRVSSREYGQDVMVRRWTISVEMRGEICEFGNGEV